MIKKLDLDNFKCYRKLDNFRIKPVTILCGANSCGKSTIIKSILLLKQTMESRDPDRVILKSGKYTNLGSFRKMVHGRDPTRDITYTLRISFSLPLHEELYLTDFGADIEDKLIDSFQTWEFEDESGIEEDIDDAFESRYKILLSFTISSTGGKDRHTLSEKLYVKKLVINQSVKRGKSSIPGPRVEIEHIDGEKYKIQWKNFGKNPDLVPTDGETEIEITRFHNLFPWKVKYTTETRQAYDVIMLATEIQDFLRKVINSFTYIGPLREEPSRRYIYEDEVTDLGLKGENAAYILAAEGDKKIIKTYYPDNRTGEFHPVTDARISDVVDFWLDKMGIEKLRSESNGEVLSIELEARDGKTRVSIADVGFGVSQILPILVGGARLPYGGTLVLEQPEIHLHPNLQMELSDFLIAMALSGRNSIVETHSDHMINRLVRRIVEDEKYNIKDLVAIYFARPGKNGSILEPVEIDDYRGIMNWPEEFFDQAANEQQKIIEAGLKKRRKRRKNAAGR